MSVPGRLHSSRANTYLLRVICCEIFGAYNADTTLLEESRLSVLACHGQKIKMEDAIRDWDVDWKYSKSHPQKDALTRVRNAESRELRRAGIGPVQWKKIQQGMESAVEYCSYKLT
jgi:hypothetical protein